MKLRVVAHAMKNRLNDLLCEIDDALSQPGIRSNPRVFRILSSVSRGIGEWAETFSFLSPEVSYRTVSIDEVTTRMKNFARMLNRQHSFTFTSSVAQRVSQNGICLAAEEILCTFLINSAEALAIAQTAEKHQTIALDFSPSDKDGYITATVTDNGPGIPPQFQDEIFKAGFTTKGNRAGMGLCLARKLAEGIGGSVILLRSEWGQGATFALTLPAKLS
jgi:C4-dicarboxylate-specific signal transduction histidine kinase